MECKKYRKPMFTTEFTGINDFLVKSSQILLEYGVVRETRGYKCYELPEPFMFKIKEPTARLITIPERNWNVILPYAESLWLASGRNDMDFITHYLKKMGDFSDDGIYMRGGYGPRLRFFNPNIVDYSENGNITERNWKTVDQFRYVIDCFTKDINTRRAVINIDDTIKDEFEADGCLKDTKDIPCTRLLHFTKNVITGKLDLTVFMRSNDMLWGASAVNIFNFTFMQEYFAAILGMEIGCYYHIANNFHYYEDKRDMLENLASVVDYKDYPYIYDKKFASLSDFDSMVSLLIAEETKMRNDYYLYKPQIFEDGFFKDWYTVLFYKKNPQMEIDIQSPTLKELLISKR